MRKLLEEVWSMSESRQFHSLGRVPKPPLIQTCWLKDLLYTPIRQYHMPPKISFHWDQP